MSPARVSSPVRRRERNQSDGSSEQQEDGAPSFLNDSTENKHIRAQCMNGHCHNYRNEAGATGADVIDGVETPARRCRPRWCVTGQMGVAGGQEVNCRLVHMAASRGSALPAERRWTELETQQPDENS
ncbi:unnamed protein product [Pleuronectes platessa]|uniref:Uncharacterized protein n=1 Tax=Pleuronectes platessa TaxID=8262 RepID=A0A9N7UC02_PLEPL|nr:unnamed protein product [Pleuronectes platessa]